MTHEHVRVAVKDATGPGVEDVSARHVSGSEWQLLRSPLYATEVAAGDIVKVTDHDTGAFEIVARGGNVCVQFYLGGSDVDDAELTTRVARRVERDLESLGGSMDANTPGLIAFTVPVDVGFPAIEKGLCGRVRATPWS